MKIVTNLVPADVAEEVDRIVLNQLIHSIRISYVNQYFILHVTRHPLNSLFSRTTCISRDQKPIWILMKQEMMGWQWHQLDHMQIIHAPRSRQITMPTPHHSFLTDWMVFLMTNQQCQSTEGKSCTL